MPHALGAVVVFDEGDEIVGSARDAQVANRFRVDGEDSTGRAVFGGHIGDSGAVGEGQVGEARAEEFNELADDAYDLGEIAEVTLGYEEADLAAPRKDRKLRRIGLDVYAEVMHGPLMRFGAAGVSSWRDKALIQPAAPGALKVNPAPMVVADKSSLQVAGGGQTHTSFWRADQMRRFDLDLDLDAAASQVAELAEVA